MTLIKTLICWILRTQKRQYQDQRHFNKPRFSIAKIGSCHFDHILFGLDFFICGKHHWMFCDAINQYQINIFSRSCNLDFDMGNVSLMIFPLIKYIGFNFPFATVAQFRSKSPFIVIKKLAFSKRAEPRSIASKVTVLADL